MASDRKNILVTGSLDEHLEAKLLEQHNVDIVPFIRVEPIVTEEIKREVAELAAGELHVVFTSNNGVQAVSVLIGDTPPAGWKMFAMEGVTSKSVIAHFGDNSLVATAYSGEELAGNIVKQGGVKEVVFFCGDLRRDELPERLRMQGVNVKEVVVYNTIGTPVELGKDYEAILFFSPSAVYSYVSVNKVPDDTVCFAIGNTTANTIKNIIANKVIIAQPPQKEVLVDMLIEYFKRD